MCCRVDRLTENDVLEALQLAGLPALTPFGVRALAEGCGASLQAVDLSGNERLDADACIRALGTRCPQLRTLCLNDCLRLTDAGLSLARAGGLPRLEVLEAKGCVLVSESVRLAASATAGPDALYSA